MHEQCIMLLSTKEYNMAKIIGIHTRADDLHPGMYCIFDFVCEL
jgi:hypothetical protein